jgi:hypothetical protein
MLEALQPTQDPDWVLSHEGYNVLTESAFESRFAFGNGFLGMRAARSVSRGPTWVAWLDQRDSYQKTDGLPAWFARRYTENKESPSLRLGYRIPPPLRGAPE